MPRRNLAVLIAVSMISLACYQRANRRYGEMYDTFAGAMDTIQARYVEPVDDRELFEGAMTGMVGQLDEHSAFFPPREYNELQDDLDQEFGGIGIQVGLDAETQVLTVTSPLVGTPAYRAGILAGDKILEVDGKSTDGFTMDEAMTALRGEPGEMVRLKVLHLSDTEPVVMEIVREIIEIETVLGDAHAADGSWNFVLEEHPEIGYVRITQFGQNTAAELEEALDWLAERETEALILDLRNDPGGLLDAAIEVCDLFVERGLIVSTRGRGGEELESWTAEADGTFSGFPMVVLVNGYSASASEIVAACLQDHERAAIVGQRTYGKGSVQDVIPLENNNSALKLTIASYWRPSGKNIHQLRDAKEDAEWGVLPDPGLEVKIEAEAFEKLFLARRDRDVVRPAASAPSAGPLERHDPQLDKAVEHLLPQLEAAETTAAS